MEVNYSNIVFITKNANQSPEFFNPVLSTDSDGKAQWTIQENSFLTSLFLTITHTIFGTKEHNKNLQNAIESSARAFHDTLIANPPSRSSDEFLISQKYNQYLHMARHELGPKEFIPQLFRNLNLNMEIGNLAESLHVRDVIVDKMKRIPDNQRPYVIQAGTIYKHQEYHYNQADLAHNHTWDAAQIFAATHGERFVSMVGRMCEAVAEFFGCKISVFSEYHYFKNNEHIPLPGEIRSSKIYAEDAPLSDNVHGSSYFVGHATCSINVPVKTNKEDIFVNIITDPVESDLNTIFYPRMTEPGRKMEDCPIPHVFLLSHNHLDHYDHDTIVKLVHNQPIVLVPMEDKPKFTALGFKNVYEMDWWKRASIQIEQGDNKGTLEITAVPANHWSGQGPCDGHHAGFNGYVIHKKDGDIYFAGDTARLSNEHIQTMQERFNIRTMFQPGGPDEARKNMEGTHQSSADALWMHFEMLRGLYAKGRFNTKGEFIEEAKKSRTIYMHNKTYKLGNLHFSDTDESVKRIKDAFTKQDITGLRSHEVKVYLYLLFLLGVFKFTDGSTLSYGEIVGIIDAGVVIPKIGERTDFET